LEQLLAIIFTFFTLKVCEPELLPVEPMLPEAPAPPALALPEALGLAPAALDSLPGVPLIFT
jgi:hypothetical protein